MEKMTLKNKIIAIVAGIILLFTIGFVGNMDAEYEDRNSVCRYSQNQEKTICYRA